MNYKNIKIVDHNGDISKRWCIEYYYLHPDTLKFERHRVWVSSKLKTRTARYADIKQERDTLTQKLACGYSPYQITETRITIQQALTKIIELKTPYLGKRAKSDYKSITKNFCDWLIKKELQHLTPRQLNKATVQHYVDSFALQGISKVTYNNRVATLKTLFKQLVLRDYADINVFEKIQMLPPNEAPIIRITALEKEKIKTHLTCVHPELWLIAQLIYYSFIRPAEICRLKLKDIDFDKNLIFINSQLSKNKKNQTVIVPGFLIEQLKEKGYHLLNLEWYLVSNYRLLKPGLIPIAPTRIAEAWNVFVKKGLGITKNIYHFKHTGAGELFEAGADARNIQKQLRHHSLDETQVYLEKFSNRPNENLRQYFKPV